METDVIYVNYLGNTRSHLPAAVEIFPSTEARPSRERQNLLFRLNLFFFSLRCLFCFHLRGFFPSLSNCGVDYCGVGYVPCDACSLQAWKESRQRVRQIFKTSLYFQTYQAPRLDFIPFLCLKLNSFGTFAGAR